MVEVSHQNDEYTAEMEKIMGEGGREKAGRCMRGRLPWVELVLLGKKRKSKGSKLSSAESTRVAELSSSGRVEGRPMELVLLVELWIARHQWHQAKLEQLIRKLDNEEEVDYDELEITEQALEYACGKI